MKYEVIIFDADETLFDFKKSEKAAFTNAMLEFNMGYNEDYYRIYSGINEAIWKEFEKGSITQKQLQTERFRRLSDKLNIELDEVEFSRAYERHLSEASFLFDGSVELIESLRKNYRLTMVTNGLKRVQDNRIKKSVIGKYFEDIVVSEEVQAAKPDPRIFEAALRNINYADRSRVLMVGDSLTSDIQGGINSGIDTCWFNPGRIKNETSVKPTYEIHGFNELLNLLDPQA